MKRIIYELGISILAVIAVILAILDISKGLNYWQQILDNIILIIFVIEYFTRLVIAKDKKQFIKSNILDLIAIIPFNSVFRIFRIAKLAKLARLTKLAKLAKFSRLLAYVGRMFKKSSSFFNTNGFKYMIMVASSLIVVGAIAISYFEEMSFSDSIWWAFVTTTTVGYGDLSPSTDIGRCIAVILMITGIGLIGSLTSTITSFFFNLKSSSVKDDTIDMIKNKLDSIESLSDDDIDNICNILKSFNNRS